MHVGKGYVFLALKNNGPMTCKEIAKMLGSKPGTIYNHLNRLMDEQRVVRVPVEQGEEWAYRVVTEQGCMLQDLWKGAHAEIQT